MRKVFVDVTTTASLVVEIDEGVDVYETVAEIVSNRIANDSEEEPGDVAEITDLHNTHFDNVLFTDSK